MAIYYKFKSARDYDTISMDGPFISVGFLKDKIYESKHLGTGKDLDIVISNAQTNQEYLDEAMLIPKNTSVLIRRVPRGPRIRVFTPQEPRVVVEEKVENVQIDTNNLVTTEVSAAEDEWDEFGNDLYSVPDPPAVYYSSNSGPDHAPADEKIVEESKLKALIDTPALDWQTQGAGRFGPGRGHERVGRGFGMVSKTPPPGYICHRCNVSGHFIQHCPTNGDPNYDVKRVKPPTGIPKSMLIATPNGSYSLPSGAVGVLKPNEDAFEKEMEGLPSTTRSVTELPPQLRCPLCKEVMRDAALTSKCCLESFCDKCIRDHIIAKSMCVCGVHILADSLLPNKTVRDTINRILESGNNSAENGGSMCQFQDMESARVPPPKVPSPSTSVASRGEKIPAPSNKNENETVKPAIEIAEITSVPQASAELVKEENQVDATENTNGKETDSQVNMQAPKEEIPQQVASGEQGKRKKKKPRMHVNDMQWNPIPFQDLAGPDYMMPMGPGPGPGPSNQYFNGLQPGFNGIQPGFNGFHPGFNGFAGPYPGPMPPFIGYGVGHMDMSFNGVMHPEPFATQRFGFPNIPPPHRDLAEIGNRMNIQRPVMGREEFEARKAEMKRKRESERRTEGGNSSRDGEKSRVMNSSAASSSPMKSKSGHGLERRRVDSPPRVSSRKSERDDRHRDRHSEHDHRRNHRDDDRSRDRHREADRKHRKSSKKPSSESEPVAATESEDNHKSSVFARISFPVEESSGKHRKPSKSSPAPEVASVSAVRREKEYESSDDEDRHFKRKPSRYHDRSPSDERHSKHRSKGERWRS